MAKKGLAIGLALVLVMALVVGILFYSPPTNPALIPSFQTCASGQFVNQVGNPTQCATPSALSNFQALSPSQFPLLHYTNTGGSAGAQPESYFGTAAGKSGTIFYVEANSYHASVNTATLQFSATPLTYGLVGYWPMDEATSGTCSGSAYDLSHNNYTMACSGSPTFTSGRFGGALSFPANSSAKTLASIASGPLSTIGHAGNSWTEAIWFKPTGPQSPSAGDQAFAGDTGAVTYFGHFVYNKLLPPQVAFRVYDGTLNPSAGVSITSSSYNKWQCLVAGYNYATSKVFFYLNSTLASTSYTQTVNVGGPLLGLSLGVYAKNPYSVDNYAVYNYAFSSSNANEWCASTVPVLESTEGTPLTAYYFQQMTTTVNSGSTYVSLGQVLTAGPTGTYWVDVNDYPDIFTERV